SIASRSSPAALGSPASRASASSSRASSSQRSQVANSSSDGGSSSKVNAARRRPPSASTAAARSTSYQLSPTKLGTGSPFSRSQAVKLLTRIGIAPAASSSVAAKTAQPGSSAAYAPTRPAPSTSVSTKIAWGIVPAISS